MYQVVILTLKSFFMKKRTKKNIFQMLESGHEKLQGRNKQMHAHRAKNSKLRISYIDTNYGLPKGKH